MFLRLSEEHQADEHMLLKGTMSKPEEAHTHS